MKHKRLLFYISGFAVAGLGLFLVLLLFSWFMRPKVLTQAPEHSAEELAEIADLREMKFDPRHPLVPHQEVDYSKGKSASWYPKAEAPILAELVKEGRLPPVAERVGPEPEVVNPIDAIGTYGGTFIRHAATDGEIVIDIAAKFGTPTLLRWSPQGYPLVPHIAKSYTVSPDNRDFTFELRKGVRWSDGVPFTADDILYWWRTDCLDKSFGKIPNFMKVKNKPGSVEKLGPYAVRFRFPEPNSLFPLYLAASEAMPVCSRPEHYLSRFLPGSGDTALIGKRMRLKNYNSPVVSYQQLLLDVRNPEFPRMWPWVYRTYKASPPQIFVRNPYYFMVDVKGNQLPYLDRVLFDVKAGEMAAISILNGDVFQQTFGIGGDNYTQLMRNRKKNDYQVYYWYRGDQGRYVIYANLNRLVEPGKPETQFKQILLNNKRFRQALSLAINRKPIIEIQYNNLAEPAQCMPGPQSQFYDSLSYHRFIDYNPDSANRLLDEIGLTRRDKEGYRTFPDGSRMVFYLHYSPNIGYAPGQFVSDDWCRVGIRTVLRERSITYFFIGVESMTQDFSVWTGNSEYLPLVEPRVFVPRRGSFFAAGYGNWSDYGGLYGDSAAITTPGCIAPPLDHPIRRSMELYDKIRETNDPKRQREIFLEMQRLASDNLWAIAVSSMPPTSCVVKNGVHNVPKHPVYMWPFLHEGCMSMETFFTDKPYDSPGALAQIKSSIITPTLENESVSAGSTTASSGGSLLSKALPALFSLAALLLIVLLCLRHPFVIRRILILVPVLFLISILTFVIIQFPPGDFITVKIMQLKQTGGEAAEQEIDNLKRVFFLDKPIYQQYAYWMGLRWFVTFEDRDKGLLQGNMGHSMETLQSVNDLVGDRVLLTVIISLFTILFVWLTAIPIGIFSAVRQYSAMDYILTFLGFIGMCIPGFLLALLLMYFSAEFLHIPVSGLFSAEFAAQPEWNWPKIVDLLKHVWVPVVVLGVGGTGWMVRVMRANLLDELKKPYVVTARAKGMRPIKLLFKYPVRIAINPFLSGIGALFPQIVSGEAIVAMVLSLPTVGPLLLTALMNEDMYLAGSLLMILSVLGVVGTLVSDLLLPWLDPRIRLTGGNR